MISGDNSLKVRIRVESSSTEQNAKKLIDNIKGVSSSVGLGMIEEGFVDFNVYSNADSDVREVLLARLVDSGFKVVKFTETEFSLEELFLSLTDSDKKEETE